MEKLNKISNSNMNYLFLKQIFNLEHFKDVDAIVENESPVEHVRVAGLMRVATSDFLVELSKAKLSYLIRKDFVNELREGSYLEDVTLEEFEVILKEGLDYIMGYVDGNIVELYMDMAREAMYKSVENILNTIAENLECHKNTGALSIQGRKIDYTVYINMDAYKDRLSENGDNPEDATLEGCYEVCASEIYTHSSINSFEALEKSGLLAITLATGEKLVDFLRSNVIRSIKDFKVTEIGNVFACNQFNDNEIDILISCGYNFSEDELIDCEEYYSDGLPYISVFAELDKRNYRIILCDCYNDMKYSFSDEEIEKIKEIAIRYIDSIKDGNYDMV